MEWVSDCLNEEIELLKNEGVTAAELAPVKKLTTVGLMVGLSKVPFKSVLSKGLISFLGFDLRTSSAVTRVLEAHFVSMNARLADGEDS